jgi:glycosyltransferase involved in cell wall biosynthesis
MGMNALVVAPQPFFSPRGTPFSVYYRTLVTAELGVKVDILTYGEGEEVDIPGVKIYRIPHFPLAGQVKTGPSALKFFLDILIFIWAFALIIRKRYDFVHAHEEAVFFCSFLKSILGFKLVYDMHSSLPQQLTNFNFTRSKILIGLFKYLEKISLSSSDAVITICPELAKEALEIIPDRKRHFLIENSIFEEVRLKVSNSGRPPILSIESLPEGRSIVAYAGTFEDYQGLDILIPAFAKVLHSKPDAFLLMVGGSPQQVEHYRTLARECNIDGNCLFTGRVAPQVARSYLRYASVITSPRKNGSNTPLKIYEQLASGSPLVATRIRSHTQVLDDKVCILVDPDPDSMAQGVLTALTDTEKSAEMVTNAKDVYEKRYSRPSYVKKMRRLLEVLS